MMRKPTPGFYNVLLKRYQVNPAEALFIDDNYRNILAAEQLGIKSIHFTSPAALAEILHQMRIL